LLNFSWMKNLNNKKRIKYCVEFYYYLIKIINYFSLIFTFTDTFLPRAVKKSHRTWCIKNTCFEYQWKKNTFIKPVVKTIDRYFDIEENAALSLKVSCVEEESTSREWGIAYPILSSLLLSQLDACWSTLIIILVE